MGAGCESKFLFVPVKGVTIFVAAVTPAFGASLAHEGRIVLAAGLKGESGVFSTNCQEEIYRTRGETMKYVPALALSLLLGLSVAVLPSSAAPARNGSLGFSQQSTSQAPQQQPEQQQPQQAAPQQQQQQQTKTFTGTMVKKGGQYLFVDDASKATRKLDHQQALSKYQLNGKKVEIVGTLDASNNEIHIIKIALLRSKA